MAETDIAMPESTQVDSRPAFAIVEELKTKFGENFYVQATCEEFPTVWVERARVQEVLMFLRKVERPYVMLFDLSAVDERLRVHRDGLPPSDFTVFYHLLSLERNSDIRIKVALNENDLNIPTATNIWPNANWYEREAYDMFGINFEGIQCSVVSCCRLIGKVIRCVKNILRVRQNIRHICKIKRNKISNKNTYVSYQKTGV